jgi:hypothetical protein
MDKSNTITSILTESDTSPIIKSNSFGFGSSSDVSNTSSEGIFGWITNISAMTWIIIILILAFLGFNIFVYLEKGTEEITSIFKPLVDYFFGTAANVTGQVVNVSAEGGKAVTSTTANAINTTLSAVQNATPQGSTGNSGLQTSQITKQEPDQVTNSALNQKLNTRQMQNQNSQDYEANEAQSTVHSAGKSGWCYIGEDRGHRSCAEVSASDQCMSGDIFPTNEICINPNLRV